MRELFCLEGRGRRERDWHFRGHKKALGIRKTLLASNWHNGHDSNNNTVNTTQTMQHIPSSSLMDTVVVGFNAIHGAVVPAAVISPRVTLNSWSNSRLLSFTIPNEAQAVSLITSPLEKFSCRGDGSVKSCPSTTTTYGYDNKYFNAQQQNPIQQNINS